MMVAVLVLVFLVVIVVGELELLGRARRSGVVPLPVVGVVVGMRVSFPYESSSQRRLAVVVLFFHR